MTKSELIQHLTNVPDDAIIDLFWDGNPRGDIDGVVFTAGRVVLIGDWSIYRTMYPENEVLLASVPRPPDGEYHHTLVRDTGVVWGHDNNPVRFKFKVSDVEPSVGVTPIFLRDVFVNRVYDCPTPPQGPLYNWHPIVVDIDTRSPLRRKFDKFMDFLKGYNV